MGLMNTKGPIMSLMASADSIQLERLKPLCGQINTGTSPLSIIKPECPQRFELSASRVFELFKHFDLLALGTFSRSGLSL
jgi:hypothetical protein